MGVDSDLQESELMPTAKPNLRAGSLFPQDARSAFLRVTGQRYDAMRARFERKKLPSLPFSKDELRADILAEMGGRYDGALVCRYCHRHLTLEEIAIDHAAPLSRGGALDLSNLDYPCKACNDAKGGLTLSEFEHLLAYLDQIHPFARKDILSRLKKANALAAGAARARGMMAELDRIRKGQPGKKKQQDSEYFTEIPDTEDLGDF